MKQELKKIKDILSAIKAETVPMPGHDDPGVITDCWNEVEEYLDTLIEPEDPLVNSRQNYIDNIGALFPPDSNWVKTSEIGRHIMDECIERVGLMSIPSYSKWRELPTETLQKMSSWMLAIEQGRMKLPKV